MRLEKANIVKHIKLINLALYKNKDLKELMEINRKSWGINESTSYIKFLNYLKENTNLKEIRLKFPSRTEIAFSWREINIYELLFFLKPNAFFSHLTAMIFHKITSSDDKNIYLNIEQSPKINTLPTLEQKNLDFAFNKKVRLTNNKASFENYIIHLLSGKSTGQLGVIETTGFKTEKIRITDIYRTLIDITVRPSYSGGPRLVLKAYKLASNKIKIPILISYLKKMDFVYPYFQAVGFYLEHTQKFDEKEIELVQEYITKFDFYLDYGMRKTNYSKKWKLYYPQNLK